MGTNEFRKKVSNDCQLLCFFSLAIPPISLCLSMSTLIGSGFIFLAAVIYGMMVLGPK